MSWQGYVENLEQGKGKCTYAGIFSLQGDPWAVSQTTKIQVSQGDANVIIKAIKKQDDSIMGTGVKLGNTNFTCLRLEPDLLICQGKGDCKDYGLVCAVSTQALIVGVNCDSDVKTECVREAVESVRDYLKGVGY